MAASPRTGRFIGDSGDDLEYIDQPVSRSSKRRYKDTPNAVQEIENDSDDDAEYVNSLMSRFRKYKREDSVVIDNDSDDGLEYI